MTNVHTDIEVLRSEIGALRTNVSEVGAKMDMLLAMQVQLVGLQKDVEHTRLALDRAFDSLRSTRDQAVRTESTLTKTISTVRGAAIVATVLYAFVQWWVLQQFESFDRTVTAVNAVERRLHVVETKIWPDTVGGKP